jgi:hypothetical protein
MASKPRWGLLLDAKKQVKVMEKELDNLLKFHSSFSFMELKNNSDSLIGRTEQALEEIVECCKVLKKDLMDHKNLLRSKSRFLRRHYRIR